MERIAAAPREAKASFGEGRYAIDASALRCGDDLVVAFTGGELAHVGATSLAVYEPERDSATVSTMTVHTHRDDFLAARGAKRLATRFRCTACVSVGIHVDDATEDDLRILCDNFDSCIEALVLELQG